MKRQYTRWSPDTCDCDFIYTWDSDTSPETRVHTLHIVNRKCDAHNNEKDETLLGIILEESQRKNYADVKAKEGDITWEWTGQSPNRVLHIYHAQTKEKLAEIPRRSAP